MPQVWLLPTVLLLYPPGSQCFGPPRLSLPRALGDLISLSPSSPLVSKSASPTTVGAFSSLLALGHSLFQWPIPQHQAHRFGCNGARGLCWDLLKGCPVPGAGGGFPGGPKIDFPGAAASIANLQPVLFYSSLYFFPYFFSISVSLFRNTFVCYFN